MLVAVVDPHVGISWPDQHRIDAAEALLQVIEIAVDSVFACDRIVEVAILDHHLRLNEARLGPLQRWHVVARTTVSDPDEPLITPMCDISKPAFLVFGGAGFMAS